MKPCIVLALLLALAAPVSPAGQPAQGRELSPAETDRAIDDVFNGAMGVVRMEADLVTQRAGGMVRGSQNTYEYLRLEAPTRMILENRGESQARIPSEETTVIIVDGRNIWEAEARRPGARERTVSRRSFRPNLDATRAQGRDVFFERFLIGGDLPSANG
ncbi:MAG: hypothetical protein LIP77_11165, partial [Planctomycetes bacterium]|nr:hypothetical protein [Planctomycetota bacterium]